MSDVPVCLTSNLPSGDASPIPILVPLLNNKLFATQPVPSYLKVCPVVPLTNGPVAPVAPIQF